jgi:Spy/CpxP family protein refolding chaperone
MDEQTVPPAGRRFRFRRGILYGLLGSGALAAAFAARPLAASVREGGFGGWHGRWGHHGMGPGAMHEHIGVAVKWALRDVDATDEQQAKVSAIVESAFTDFHRLRDQHHANRDEFRALLGAAGAVDRDALEKIRKAELALADEASRRAVQALADAADALTPEQRKALLERHSRRRH